MFIRFVSGEIDEDSHVSVGLFTANAAILERNDVFIRTIKVKRTGYILYEDEAQIFAEPFADIRRVLWR